MANQKLQQLIFPGSEDVYQIDAMYIGGKTPEEWLKTADAMIFKDTIAGASSSPGTYTPKAERGHTYKVSSAGYINGVKYEVGDILICAVDSTAAATSSTYSSIQNNWTAVQGNGDYATVNHKHPYTAPPSKTNSANGTTNGTTGSSGRTGTSATTGTNSGTAVSAVTGISGDGTADVLTGVKANSTDTFLKTLNTGSGYLESYTASSGGTKEVFNGNRIQFVKSISSTGASGTLTNGFVTTIDGGSGSLTSNTISTGGLPYIKSITYTAAKLTGTTEFNTDAIKSITLSESTTSTDGPQYIKSISGGSAVSKTSKYMKFTPGTTPPASADFEGTTGSTSSSNDNVDVISGYSNFRGGSGSITSYASTATGRVKYVDSISQSNILTDSVNVATDSHTHTTEVHSHTYDKLNVSVSGVTLVISSTPTSTTSANVVINESEEDPIAVISSVSGGVVTPTYKYLAHTHTAASLGTPTTKSVATNNHTHTYTPEGIVTFTPGIAPLMNFDTDNSGDNKYIYDISGGSAVTASTRYMKATTTAASTASVGIDGGSIDKTTEYLHHTHTPAAVTGTAKAVTAVSGGTTTATIRYLEHSHIATTAGTSASAVTEVSPDGTTEVLTSVKVTSTSNVAPADHTHSYTAPADHTHSYTAPASHEHTLSNTSAETSAPTN